MGEHDPEQQRRRQRRDYIRTHHPDVGGDPTEFIAGLARFDEPSSARRIRPAPRVFVVKNRPWPVTVIIQITTRIGRSRRPPRVH